MGTMYTRRKFVKSTAAASVGAIAAGNSLAMSVLNTAPKKRYVIVGTGTRSWMYQDAIEKSYIDHAQLVGFCDVNEGRLKLSQSRSVEHTGNKPPVYLAADFDEMISEKIVC